MKRWEESWEACSTDDGTLYAKSTDEHIDMEIGHIYDPPRAKLASQAPAMARLLLEEWRGMTEAERRGSAIDKVLRDAGVVPPPSEGETGP